MRPALTVGVLALDLVIMLWAPADAAPAHRATAHLRARHHLIIRPSQGATAPAHFAVPGWTDEQTQRWLDAPTSCEGCG
jgi:hypothetical protein